MSHEDKITGNSLRLKETRRAFLTSLLAGCAFGLIAGTVFLLMGVVDLHPVIFLPGLMLLTGSISGLAGTAGAVLDNFLQDRGIKSNLLRLAVTFLLLSGITFSIAALLVKNFGWDQAAPTLQQFAVPGMFLGLVFGAVVALVNYRLWSIQQKVRMLEIENRYLAELAEKDRLLQEAARNLAVNEERNRMARELHDSISQGMHGIVFSLHSLRRQLSNNAGTAEIVSHLEATTQATLQELRRLIMELTPSPLDDGSLNEALALHADLFSRRQQIELAAKFDYHGTLAPEQEEAIYRITQEALANIQKHAGAKRVELSLHSENNSVVLRIKDNGRGFDPQATAKGNGLRNMATRARQNNGEFNLKSSPATGTSIEVVFAENPL